MQPYWSHTYSNIKGMGEEQIELYKYLDKTIVLRCSTLFSKGFGSYIRDIGGVFSANVDIGMRGFPGWCFGADSQSKLQDLISDISRDEKTPNYDDESENKNIAIFQQLQGLIEMIPQTGEDYVLSETDEMRTFLKFGEDLTDHNCVISVNTARKNLRVYQV